MPAVVLLIALAALGCRKSSNQGQHSPLVLSIDEVLADPRSYSHRLITVKGCYVDAFERSIIEPCGSSKYGGVVWLENAETLATISTSFTPEELVPRGLKAEFVFRYDRSKSRAAWQKLARIAPNGGEVTLTGQFDTSAPEILNAGPPDFKPGFGHLAQYQHRFILVDVLACERKK
jgi:hypothetical protein